MSTQMLIYETAVPVSSERHAKCSVETGKGYGFARNINSVPLMAVEFPQAEPEYAIVFVGENESTMPAAILGARRNENLYLGPEDSWQASYIPAFLRRYPFIFSTSDDGKTFTLCVDEAFPGVNFRGRGDPLFTGGKPSAYTDSVLKFVESYRLEFLRTEAFCKKLRQHELLEPMQAQFTLGTGEKMALSGFLVVNRDKLKALSGEVLADLARSDALELIYLHLQSMRNFVAVKDKLMLNQGDAASTASSIQ
jgi:SapC protein